MKVLYIADPGIVGGATRSLVELVTSLRSLGVECIVCTSANNSLNVELENAGVENFSSGHKAIMDVRPKALWKKPIKYVIKKLEYYLMLPSAIRKIEDSVDLFTIDIIHTNSARNDIGAVLSRKYRIPHVVHFREYGEEDFDCWTYRSNYISFLNKYSCRFIAISNSVMNSWIKKGIQREKFSVIYNGVDGGKIVKREAFNMDTDTPLKLVITGGVYLTKGQYQIIEAIACLPENIKANISLDIIGWSDEVYILSLKNRIRDLQLTDQISFLRSRSDVYEILHNYDIGLMCSKSEGFGRVTVEYMHAGLGVIASNTGANPEIIHNEVNGLLYKWNDFRSLANKIEEFYKDRVLLRRCALEGQKNAIEYYTKERNAKNIKALYETI